jgi:hypothetical protein
VHQTGSSRKSAGQRLWTTEAEALLRNARDQEIPRLMKFPRVGVHTRHGRAGMAEQALDDVLGHPLVDEPGPERVPELVRGYPDRPAGAVV